MTDAALRIKAIEVDIFCRVNPQQKHQIILALKAMGRTVGYMGDGINDAAALHSADVGISVDSATDVAREAASIILLERSLAVIHNGVMQGRRTVVNISKYILMASSANFGNMFSMVGGALLVPFLPMLPTQILLGNLLYDIAQIGLPFDRVDSEAIEKPVRWDMKFIRRFMFILGPVASIFDFLTFYLLLYWFGPNEVLFHSGWFIESLAPQMLTIFAIRTRRRLFTSWPHPLVAALAVGMSAVIVALPFTPLGHWFGLIPPPPLFFLFVAGIVIAYFTLLEIVKAWLYRHFDEVPRR
jgi:Mg2+-importing ATPase